MVLETFFFFFLLLICDAKGKGKAEDVIGRNNFSAYVLLGEWPFVGSLA